jgi:ribose-phosphate pyrophosphokinase
MSMLFFAYNAKELGAKSVGLVAPYLGYMRQDKRFHEGEAITSRHFAHMLSGVFDRLITIDPHLHRYHSLDEIYTIPSCVLHASDLIVEWVKGRVESPLFIGPDSESEQWVSQVARRAGAPFIVLDKERSGDYQVAISSPKIDAYRNTHTPVLVDDIISTARTMIETVKHLELLEARPAVCIGVHAVFADQAYEALQKEHVHQVISCNTIVHHSNAIDVSSLIASAL